MLNKNKKIAILNKAVELCKSKSYPNFSQAEIIRKAQDAGQDNNSITKGTLSKYLASPETSYVKFPPLFYDVILDMFKEHKIDFSFSDDEQRLSPSDLPHVMSMFMDISEQDKKTGRQSLPCDYWGYMPSIEKEGCIVKLVLRIKENREGVLTAEEKFYYNKEGFVDVVKQQSQGYIFEKNRHCLMILNDPSSYLPKMYVLRKEPSTSNKCIGFEGGSLIVSPSGIGINTIQRKIRFTRSKQPITSNKEALINEHGIGIHKPDTEDAVVRSLFDKLLA